MKDANRDLYAQEYFNYLQKRGELRKFIRKFYLKNIRKYCIGKSIDFGCGIGELLSMLPIGSIGFEVNEVAVAYCKSIGLAVELYIPEKDHYRFNMIPPGTYTTFTMNHVLEHIDNANEVIVKIFESCERLGIQRIVFTVPGYLGFRLDKTHRTFIDRQYFSDHHLFHHQKYRLRFSGYFPFPWSGIGHLFRHNELRMVFDKKDSYNDISRK